MEDRTTTVWSIDKLKAAADASYSRSQQRGRGFCSFSSTFTDQVLGDSPCLTLISSRPTEKFAHEAGVYIKSTNSIYFTSNFATSDPVDNYRITCDTREIEKLDVAADRLPNTNGACHYKDQVLYCCQGTRTLPSSLTLLDPQTRATKVLINNFHGREFNSINDVVVHHASGDIFFTDPTYGWEQNFRPSPTLPSQVYRFRPSTGDVQCVADGFIQCNGLCFSPDYRVMYITDTAQIQAHEGPDRGAGFSANLRLPATIYAYDVIDGELTSGSYLVNRRVFAYCDNGVPDGIKCDDRGNVYSGCGDGVQVWNPAGQLIGKILTDGIVANFCFSPSGMWIFAEERLFLCELKAKGALIEVENAQS